MFSFICEASYSSPSFHNANKILSFSKYFQTLDRALGKMWADGYVGPYYQPVHTYVMNPKAVTAGELYGEVNPFTLEWRDGLMGIMVRTAVNVSIILQYQIRNYTNILVLKYYLY